MDKTREDTPQHGAHHEIIHPNQMVREDKDQTDTKGTSGRRNNRGGILTNTLPK